MHRSRWAIVLVALALLAGACSRSSKTDAASTATTAADTTSACKSTLQATDVGVTAGDITIQVMADVGSPLSPGLFQGNVDAVNAFAKYWNAHGGIGCRQVKVIVWDSKLDASASKDGLINACRTSFAMVGDNALFNPDVAPITECADKAGVVTGVPDIAALANDIHEMCAKTLYTVQALSYTCPARTGVQPITAMAGVAKWFVDSASKGEKLHGLFLVPGDLPTTVQSATPLIAAQQ